MNVILYVRDLEKAKKGAGGLPDRQKLTEARTDLDRVLSVRPCLRTHLEMAQVKAHPSLFFRNYIFMQGSEVNVRVLIRQYFVIRGK